MISTYLINRKCDVRRKEFIVKQAQKIPNICLKIIDAVDGHSPLFQAHDYLLSNYNPKLSTPKSITDRVILAIGLSHAKCWQKILDGDSDYGLIIEDDIIFENSIDDLETNLNNLSDFDLIFVNERMVLRRTLLQKYGIPSEGLFVSTDENYLALRKNIPEIADMRQFKKSGRLKGVGGYGYVLSKSGAKKMLKQFEKDAIGKHIDIYLYFSSLSYETINTYENEAIISNISKRMRKREFPLDAYIYFETIAASRDSLVGGSVRVNKQ